jgi:hypothetical protein
MNRTLVKTSTFAIVCFVTAMVAMPAAQADELRAPVVSKKKLSPGETKTLNPQPIPPGKSNSAVKHSSGADKSIIFVGGKTAKNSAEVPVACCRGKTGKPSHDARNIRPEEKK